MAAVRTPEELTDLFRASGRKVTAQRQCIFRLLQGDETHPSAEAIHAAASDDAFAGEAEANGYYAAWADGPTWLAQMQTEQADLAKLWETNPWLSPSGG